MGSMSEIVQKLGIDASQALKALEQLDAGYAKLQSRLDSVVGTIGNYNKAVGAASKSTLAPALKSSAQAADDATKSVERLTVSTGLIARILTTQLTVSLFSKFRQELQEVAGEAAEFQKQVALITTIGDGVTFDQAAESAKNLSKEFNIPLLDATAGLYQTL